MTDPGVNDDERHAIADLMAQGVYAGVNLATPDLDRAFERLEANGGEVVQEPIDQDYGISRLRGPGPCRQPPSDPGAPMRPRSDRRAAASPPASCCSGVQRDNRHGRS